MHRRVNLFIEYQLLCIFEDLIPCMKIAILASLKSAQIFNLFSKKCQVPILALSLRYIITLLRDLNDFLSEAIHIQMNIVS